MFFSSINLASDLIALQIDPDSLVSFGTSIDANFPMKPDLVINALDSGGRIITDGSDSSLVS